MFQYVGITTPKCWLLPYMKMSISYCGMSLNIMPHFIFGQICLSVLICSLPIWAQAVGFIGGVQIDQHRDRYSTPYPSLLAAKTTAATKAITLGMVSVLLLPEIICSKPTLSTPNPVIRKKFPAGTLCTQCAHLLFLVRRPNIALILTHWISRFPSWI